MKNSEEIMIPKPIFWKNLGLCIFTILDVIVAFIPFLIPNFADIKIFNLPLNWLILICSSSIFFIVYIVIYTIKINSFYKEYEAQFKEFLLIRENRDMLVTSKEKLKRELNRMQRSLVNAGDIIEDFIKEIEMGTLIVNEYEKAYLLNLLGIANKKKEYINKLKGENNARI